MTASQVFHMPFDEVTPLQRRNAKAVNFGIVYGISSFGLSQDLSITRKEAAEYIEQYFETYPGVKAFLDDLVEEAKGKGLCDHPVRPQAAGAGAEIQQFYAALLRGTGGHELPHSGHGGGYHQDRHDPSGRAAEAAAD